MKVLPQLLMTSDSYARWLENVITVVGVIPLVVGLIGLVLTPQLRLLGFLLALAYLLYSAVFTWHTMTHDYYQVPLLVIVAIGLGGFGELLARWSREGSVRKTVVAAGIVLAGVLNAVLAPTDLLGPTPYRYPDAGRLAAIGSSLGPGERAIAFSGNYGFPLMYYGRLIVSAWPTRSDIVFAAQRGQPPMSADIRLSRMKNETQARYFVVTLPARSDPELTALLNCSYQIVISGVDWQVYDLSSPEGEGSVCLSGEQ
jgi:hypothetical protein